MPSRSEDLCDEYTDAIARVNDDPEESQENILVNVLAACVNQEGVQVTVVHVETFFDEFYLGKHTRCLLSPIFRIHRLSETICKVP